MRSRNSASLLSVLVLVLFAFTAARAVTTAGTAAAPQRQVLTGYVPIWAVSANDRGLMPEHTMKNLTIVLARPAAKQAALDNLMNGQQTAGSPNYRRWLSQKELGEQFGPDASEVQAVTAWLATNKLHIENVSVDRTRITFSGESADVSRAFGVSFHSYNVHTPKGDKASIALTANPKVPASIAPSIAAVSGLFTEIAYSDDHAIEYPKATNLHLMTASAFNTQYSLTSTTTPQGVSVDGTGVRVAIIGLSQVKAADIKDYQTEMGLNVNAQPNTIIPPAGSDPGVNGNQSEQTLDVNRVMSVAPGAWVDLIVSGDTDGLYTAASYNVNTLVDPVMTLSYGGCEQVNGTTTVTKWTNLFQTAASEGISVMVSSGDSGAECGNAWNNNNPNASKPYVDVLTPTLGINYLCSNAYVTCVGGTTLNDGPVISVGLSPNAGNTTTPAASATATATVVSGVITAITPVTQGSGYTSAPAVTIYGAGTGATATAVLTGDKVTSYTVTAGGTGYKAPTDYWTDAGTTYSTLKGYVPESAFNQSIDEAGYLQVGGSNGGVSLYTARPAYQSGTAFHAPPATLNGLTTTGKRLVPDVALAASGHDGFFQCINLDCENGKYSTEAGTSAAAPSMAGIMARIVQGFGKQGNFNSLLYNLFNQGAYGTVYHGTTSVSAGVATCVATTPSPCNNSQPGLTGYTVGDFTYGTNNNGYNLVTGIGSINSTSLLGFNVNNPANGGNYAAGSSGSYHNTLTTPAVAFGSLSTITSGTAIDADLNATVKNGVTDVASLGTLMYTATSTAAGAAPQLVKTGTVLAPGTYTLRAYWQPNATASLTTTGYNIGGAVSGTMTVSKATSTTGTVSLTSPSSSTFAPGTTATLSVTVSGSSGTPTGSVQFYDGSTAIGAAQTLDITGKATLSYQFNATGTPSIKATYAGDTAYNTSTSATALSLTVTQATLAVTASPTTLTITRGNSGTSTFTFTPSGAYSGTVALSCNGLPAYASCTFSANPVTFNNSSTVQTSTLTIYTLAPQATGGTKSGLLWIPAMLLGMLLWFGRRNLNRPVRAALMLAVLACISLGATGCGRSSYATPLGSSTTTVTAVASATATTSVSANSTVTLTVIIQ